MNCPRCNTKLGEDDVYCPECGLSLMDWFMKDDFDTEKKEEPLKDEEDIVEETEENKELEETGKVFEDKPYNGMDSDNINSEWNQAPFGDLYGDMSNNPYQDPFGGFGYGIDDDPYKNILRGNKSNPPSDIQDDPYKKNSEETVSDKNQILKTNDTAAQIDQVNTESKDKTEAKKTEKPEKPSELKKEVDLQNSVKQKQNTESPKSEKEKKRKGKKLWTLFVLAACLGVGYWFGQEGREQLHKASISNVNENVRTEEQNMKEVKQKETEEAVVTPAEEILPETTAAPTSTPIPTPTPEPVLTWQGEVTRENQESVMAEGTWLDRNYMKSLMDASNARYGLYVMDLTNYTNYAIGEAKTPLPASALIGIPIMYTIAEGISTNTYSMDNPVLFTYTFANGRGNMKSDQNGQYFPLGDLLKEALLYSDNNALNSLIDYLTLDRINNICHQYGFESVDMQRKLMTESTSLENYISPEDAAMMLNAIYQNNFTEIDRSFLINYYKLVPGDAANKGMYPACGNCDVFLNLNGITETRYNEVGLVENGEEVFIMAVMTADGKHETSAPCVTNEASYVLANLQVGKR